MSIIVDTLLTAACDECGWFGYRRKLESSAVEDLEQHKDFRHRGDAS